MTSLAEAERLEWRRREEAASARRRMLGTLLAGALLWALVVNPAIGWWRYRTFEAKCRIVGGTVFTQYGRFGQISEGHNWDALPVGYKEGKRLYIDRDAHTCSTKWPALP